MTIASALDHLTDVLANRDVAGYQTIEQSINNISDMIEDGEISLGGSISPATADTLGGVKIGEGISVTDDGTISAGGASALIVNDVDGTLDKTWQEIHDALEGGSSIAVKQTETDCFLVLYVRFDGENYIVGINEDSYSASTADGYPVYPD